MLYNLFAAIIGCVFNRIRGGGLTDLAWKMNWAHEGDETFWKSFSKIINDVVFGLVFTFALNGYTFSHFSFTTFFILYGMMFLGRAPGWGSYIGGMIDKEVKGEKEIEQIDEIILNKTNYPVLRNTIALSLRGAMWSVSLMVGFALVAALGKAVLPSSFVYLGFVGLLMGPVYLTAIEVSDRLLNKGRGAGWQNGELMFGFVLWGATAVTTLGI